VVAIPVALLRGLLQFGVKEPWVNLDHQLVAASNGTAAAAGILSVIVIWMSRRKDDSKFGHRRRRWYFALICLASAQGWLWQSPWSEPLSELFVMAFVLVTVYYGERLIFFDVFAKRGLLFFLALVILACHFALVSPYLAFQRLVFVKSWMTALTLVPLALAMPWMYAKLNSWVDRAWLGRRFSTVGAAMFFSESLQGAINESDLLERAESSLSYIFQSKACIDPGDPAAITTEAGELRAAVRIHGTDWGTVRILPRTDEVPFLRRRDACCSLPRAREIAR